VSGSIRVTAPSFTGSTHVARRLAAFAAKHPKVAIELDASNVRRDLLADGFDFALRVGPSADADFVSRALWRGQFGLVASRELAKRLLGSGARLGREALERAPCVAMRPGVVWRFAGAAGPVEVRPKVRFVVNDPRGALEVARLGLGLALVPLEALPRRRELRLLETDFGAPEPVVLHAVYPSRRLLPLRVRLAIEWLAADPPGPRAA
jgi:LysR family transcriptional regulator, transcriptional activator AphB